MSRRHGPYALTVVIAVLVSIPVLGIVTASAIPSTNGKTVNLRPGGPTETPIPAVRSVGVDDASHASPFSILTIPVGVYPVAVGLDSSNGRLYVANAGFWNREATKLPINITVINGSTDTVAGSIPVGIYPDAVAYDAANQQVYVANGASNNLTVIDGSTDGVVGSVATGAWPDAIAYDSRNDQLFVANSNSNNLTVVDGSTDTVVGSVSVGVYPTATLYDPVNGYVYVADQGGANLSVINGNTDRLSYTIPVGSGPDCLAFDQARDQIYVTNESTDLVAVINGTTNAVVGNLTNYGWNPDAMAYDSAQGLLLVASTFNNSVAAINVSTGETVWTVSVGYYPDAALFDILNDYVYIVNNGVSQLANSNSGSVTVLNPARLPCYSVRFFGEGLPADTPWSVTLGQATENSSAPTITFLESNGSYSYSVAPLGPYLVSRSEGQIVVNGTGVGVTIGFSYPVQLTFTQSVVPNGEAWGLDVSNATYDFEFRGSPNASSVGLSVFPGGRYAYSASFPGTYSRWNTSGNVTVGIQAVTVTINGSVGGRTASSGPSWLPWVWVGLAAAFVGGAIGVLAAVRRRPRPPETSIAVPPLGPPEGGRAESARPPAESSLQEERPPPEW